MEKIHLLLLLSGLFALSGAIRYLKLFQINKTWIQARAYCRENCIDLATVEDMEKMQTLLNEYKFSFVWIGLRSGKSLNWHWSLAQKDSFKGEMDDLIQRDETGGDCGTYKNGKFTASECTNKFHAVCFDVICLFSCLEKGPQQYILTPQKMNWRVAQEHCRRQHTDLASVRNKEENHALQEVVGDQKVWTGLFRDPWEWSDGSDSSFRYWKTDMQIYNDPSNKCTALNDDRFYIRACGFKLKFLCTCEKGTTS
ncbi:macrophage mannose receptor 1-like [Labrus bergylta]|uniref:macrophage mannose receptor 1-like n=1 Tax=Labrus bergylta TaxID=56723 RepID=UPI003313D835